MKRVMVRYRVKPNRVAENQRFVEAVYEELNARRPGEFATQRFFWKMG